MAGEIACCTCHNTLPRWQRDSAVQTNQQLNPWAVAGAWGRPGRTTGGGVFNQARRQPSSPSACQLESTQLHTVELPFTGTKGVKGGLRTCWLQACLTAHWLGSICTPTALPELERLHGRPTHLVACCNDGTICRRAAASAQQGTITCSSSSSSSSRSSSFLTAAQTIQSPRALQQPPNLTLLKQCYNVPP
jgi:hypothetical protein